MPESRERLTARKVAAEDVLKGEYFEQEGFEPNYAVTPYGMAVSRARIIGTVVDTFVNDDESYGAVTIDDGTDTIRAKFFQDLDMMEGIEEGDVVEVVGKVKQYDGETYVNPEMVAQRDMEHELLRALELGEVRETFEDHVAEAEEMREDGRGDEDIMQELQGEGLNEREATAVLQFLEIEEFERSAGRMDRSEPEQAEGEDEDLRAAVVQAIETLDEGDGAEYGDIEEEAGLDEEELEDVINDLLSDGTCYEPRPGRIKKL